MKPKYYSWSKEKWEKIAKRYYYSPCLAAKQLRINYQVIIYWWDHYNIPWRTKNRRYIEAAGRRWRKEQTKNKKKGGKPLVLGKAKNGFFSTAGFYILQQEIDQLVPYKIQKINEDCHWAEEIWDEI